MTWLSLKTIELRSALVLPNTMLIRFVWAAIGRGDARFEDLRDLCDVVHLDRTQGISTTEVKERLGANEK